MRRSLKRKMRLVALGLTLSSSWGNGHATTYRALLRAFAERGHDVLFLERDKPWYSDNRDLEDPDFCELAFYRSLRELRRYSPAIAAADAVLVGSYVPEGVAVGRWVQKTATGVTAFYDIDTPVTLAKLERGDFEYLRPEQIREYDLYLSFTGGPTLQLLENRYSAPAARPLYCSVDPAAYRPLDCAKIYDLGYLGTYSPDRQPGLERLLVDTARRRPDLSFVVAGPGYPDDIEWPENVERRDHVPPTEHPAFYSACRFTLNVTRADMIRAGHSPSVRLFEAAACGTPIISDGWVGLERLFGPGRDIVVAHGATDVIDALGMAEAERLAIAGSARQRVLLEHTAKHRAAELEDYLREAASARRRHARAPVRPDLKAAVRPHLATDVG